MSSATISWEERHPIIIPKSNYTATLLVQHYHEQVAHQGRHITEGALRSEGLWILGGKRLVTSVIHKCVTCRKLRGAAEKQKMADLPADRVTQSDHSIPSIHTSWSICIWNLKRLRSTYQVKASQKASPGPSCHKSGPYGNIALNLKVIFLSQWRQVQNLADTLWSRWHQEYVVILQPRRKWQADRPKVEVRVARGGSPRVYLRRTSDLVLLLKGS